MWLNQALKHDDTRIFEVKGDRKKGIRDPPLKTEFIY